MPNINYRRRLSGGNSAFHDGLSTDFATGKYYYRTPGRALVQFATPQSMFTWSSSTKWTRQANQLFTASGANTPAYEWNTSGVALGIRQEVAKTNIGLWSDDLTNAAWVKVNVTAAKNATGPDGTVNSASTLTATVDLGTVLQTVVSASATRTFFAFARRKTGTGAVKMTMDSITYTAVTLTSSWEQVNVITGTAITNPVFGFRFDTAGDEIEVMWCQLESQGGFGVASYSSPIPTTTISVTRAEDIITMSVGTWYDQTKGTLVINGITPVGVIGLANTFAGFSDNTTANRWAIDRTLNANSINGFLVTASAAQADITSGSIVAANTAIKSALALTTNDAAFYYNGTQIGTDTSVTMPSGITLMHIGKVPNTNSLNSTIKCIDYYPNRLTNAQLAALTTP